MACSSSQSLVVAVFIIACGTAAIAADHEDAPVPSTGSSLAQGALSFQGPHMVSEVSPAGSDNFASLDDEFDHDIKKNEASGSSLAQGPVKFDGARLVSEGLSFGTDHFANLDDEFDGNMRDLLTEPTEWSASRILSRVSATALEVLASPVLYFTIAFLMFGGLYFTSDTDRPEPGLHQPVPTDASSSKESQLAESVESHSATGSDQRQPAQPEVAQPTAATPVQEKIRPPPIDLSPDGEAEAPFDEEQAKAFRAAAEACRAGQVGSYAQFCKLLAEQDNL